MNIFNFLWKYFSGQYKHFYDLFTFGTFGRTITALLEAFGTNQEDILENHTSCKVC